MLFLALGTRDFLLKCHRCFEISTDSEGETTVSLGIRDAFKMRIPKGKMVCGHAFQNAKIPRTSSGKEMKS